MIASTAISLLTCLGLARCDPTADLFFDHLLATSYLSELEDRHLDPAVLGDFQTEFEDQSVLLGNVRGRFAFSKGRLAGLARARRASTCLDSPARTRLNTTTAINCSVTFDELKVSYEGRMRYGKMPRVRVDGRCVVRDVRLLLEIVRYSNLLPTTRRFVVTSVGTAKVRLGGLSPLNKFTRVQEEVFQGHVQAKVYNFMQDRLQYALQRAIGKVSAPAIRSEASQSRTTEP